MPRHTQNSASSTSVSGSNSIPGLQAAQKILEKRVGELHYELYLEKKKATQIQVKDGAIDSLSQAEDMGLSIRVLKDGRMGFSYTTSLTEGAVQKAVDMAIAISGEMPMDEYAGFYSFSNQHYQAIDQWDEKGPSVSTQSKMELAIELERRCRSVDKRITRIRSASIGETLYEVNLVDSQGERLSHRGTFYSSSITCKAEQAGDSQMGGDYRFHHLLSELEIKQTAAEAAHQALQLLGASRPQTMVVPAVLQNSVMADLVDFISTSFYAEEMQKGRSLLVGKVGQRLFSPHLTLLQDGLLQGGYGTSPFDGEGVPARTFALIRNGVFEEAIYDTYYARKLGGKPSGCASRSIKSPPSSSVANLVVQCDPVQAKSFDELVGEVQKGILITDLMGIHTANPVTGDFSLGASGVLIEKGQLTTPVKGFAVAGNILDLLNSIQAVGSDLRNFGSVYAPSVLISKLSVGGS